MPKLTLFQNSRETVSYAAGQTIFEEETIGREAFVVVEGTVNIIVKGRTIESFGPGDLFGEMALIEMQPRSATAVAKTDCRLVAIDEQRFQFLVQQTPFFALHVMRVMAERLRKTTAQLIT